MSAADTNHQRGDIAPGEEGHDSHDVAGGVKGYLLGLAIAVALTVASFSIGGLHLLYGPSIPIALVVLAIAQMGIHLVFFLHLTTSPDNLNNALALAFGILIVLLLIGGSLFIMSNMNHNMMAPDMMMHMQR